MHHWSNLHQKAELWAGTDSISIRASFVKWLIKPTNCIMNSTLSTFHNISFFPAWVIRVAGRPKFLYMARVPFRYGIMMQTGCISLWRRAKQPIQGGLGWLRSIVKIQCCKMMSSNAGNFYMAGSEVLNLEIDQFDWKIWDDAFHVSPSVCILIALQQSSITSINCAAYVLHMLFPGQSSKTENNAWNGIRSRPGRKSGDSQFSRNYTNPASSEITYIVMWCRLCSHHSTYPHIPANFVKSNSTYFQAVPASSELIGPEHFVWHRLRNHNLQLFYSVIIIKVWPPPPRITVSWPKNVFSTHR